MNQAISPKDLGDIHGLADWLEIIALTARDSNSSRGDLERQVKRSGTIEELSEDEAINHLLDEVFIELDGRSNAVGEAYPFIVTNSLVRRRDDFTTRYLPYIFCLCLSVFGSPKAAARGVDPRLLFEHLASKCLESYLGGKSLVLGTGRLLEDPSTTVRGFAGVVEQLAKFLGEGDGFKTQSTLSRKDDGIDVVGMKPIGGAAVSNLLVFGQCATGKDWQTTGKLSQCQPEVFFDQWMIGHEISPLLRSYFIPYSVDTPKFCWAARRAGLFFERMRVSRWAGAHADIDSIADQMIEWISAVIGPEPNQA